MAWDSAVPAVGDYVNNFPAQEVGNNQVLEAMLATEHYFPNLANDGTHKISVGVATPAGAEGNIAIVNDDWYWYSNGAWHSNFDTGTKMLFVQATAPAGWTQDTSFNDQVIRVVSSAGGGTGGDWTMADLKAASHALTVPELPAHHHTYTGPQATSPLGAGGGVAYATTTSFDTGDTGSGTGHTHDMNNSGNWRPAYVDSIVCIKQ